jgi:hypothetical protein
VGQRLLSQVFTAFDRWNTRLPYLNLTLSLPRSPVTLVVGLSSLEVVPPAAWYSGLAQAFSSIRPLVVSLDFLTNDSISMLYLFFPI